MKVEIDSGLLKEIRGLDKGLRERFYKGSGLFIRLKKIPYLFLLLNIEALHIRRAKGVMRGQSPCAGFVPGFPGAHSQAATDDTLEVVGANAVVNTKSLNTNALIKSGETLALGGIYTTSIDETEDGLPLLNKIPVLGRLFKTKTQTGPNNKEMLIFITPTIVDRPSL